MADEWDAFPDAHDDSDPWAAFPDAEPAKRKSGKKRKPSATIPPITGAVDGDTLRTDGGPNVRLWGVDAPELRQPGYDALGRSVPVGLQSRNALADILTGGQPLSGPVVSISFGRPVAPLTVGGEDAGLGMIRAGNAFAAPSFLSSDPARRFDYMQAERLARQNALGPLNDNFVQRPDEYRREVKANPDYVVSRETVAQFWDTPTPDDGMRPEVEQRYFQMLNDPSVPADAIVKFAHDNGGFIVAAANIEEARAKAKETGQTIGIGYERAPQVLTDSGDGATGAAVRGYGSGFLASGLDEAGAVVDALGGTPGRENIWNSDRRLADVWANNQRQNSSILGYDQEFHPYASGAGEVAGALTSGVAIPIGQGARTAGELFRVGLGWGGASGFLGTDGSVADRLKGAAIAAPIGGVAGAGLGKAIEYGAPAIGKGARALFGKGVAEGVEPVADNAAQNAAQDVAGDPWAGFPDAAPEGPSVIDGAALRAQADNGGGVDMARAGSILRNEADAALARGDTVTLHVDGKAVPITRPGLVDDQGQSWGAMPVLSGKDAGNRLEITPSGADATPKGWEEFRREGNDRFLLYTGPDGKQANVHVNIDGEGRAEISIDPFSREANRFGPAQVRQAARDLQQLYPEIRSFHGERESGANPGRVQTMGMEADPMPSVSAPARQPDRIDVSPPVRPGRMDQPLTDAQRAALAQDVRPQDLLPRPSNEIASVEEAAARDAGRFATAKAPNERGALESRTVRNWMGQPVPKVGPVDLVGFLRLRGGLSDAGDDLGKGGNLKAMGLTNAARKGMDLVGQEHRFGPLVNNDTGMSLDEAALQAWEAGYFPDHPERPSVNEFLDALGETYNGGGGRRFLPEDMPQVEAYYGRQSDRFALEQAQHDAGGKVFVDRSEPADAPQPFPPVEAYDDRLAETAKRAGNIDLDKLDTPQDIRRALVQTEAMVGFDAATRRMITNEETARLAADLNMTADQLLQRRKGQPFNAEQALAARQILAKSGNELVNLARRMRALDHPGDELSAAFRKAWMRHVAIQEQVAGMTAEAGRALQQFRMTADSREVRGDVLGAIVTGGGGESGLRDAAQVLLDAVESGPGVFNAVAEKAAKPKWRDKISEFYINMLLSGPQTHAVNMASNTLTAIAQVPEYAAGALIGGARRAVSRGEVDRVLASEVGARAFGLLQGAKEGARLFARAIRTGEASDFASKVEGQQYKAIEGLKGEVIRIPTRLLTAEDELFKGIARRMELNAEAVRIAAKEGLRGAERKARIAELVANPTDEMFAKALDYGRYLTFQRKLGPAAQSISNFASSHLPAKLFLPFVRTPTNLLKFATERSPAAPLLKEWRADFRAGGSRRDMALARALLGTGFGMAVYEAALAGRITGSAPSDQKKARLLYADGWQPYSVRLGDQWYSYKRLDPFSTTLGVAADLATLPEGMTEKQREDKATLLVASITGNLASKTWLSGLSDLVEAWGEPDRYASTLKNRLITSFLVPNLSAQVARTVDPVRRERDGLGQEIQSRIPGLSDSLLPQRDIWGQPIANGDNLGPDILSPVWVSEQLNDPVNKALLPLDYAPGYPSRKIGEQELSPQDYDKYQAKAGQAAHASLSRLVTMPHWKGLDPEAKVKAARKVVSDARRDARESLFGNGKGDPDPWHDFEDAPDEWAGFNDAPSRDVMGELRAAIPGVRFTSGFRDDAYNQSLKARGYHPADDSEHLDGSAVDMLPPPGKSLGWLAKQVRRYDPKARLLVHDGHLHAAFNGFYGAPVLGGAKSAGVVNPNGGRR